MTAGTKIFLALFALIVGILVVYYGVMMPGNTTDAALGRDKIAANNNGTKGTGNGAGDRPREPQTPPAGANSNQNQNQTPTQVQPVPDHRPAPPPRDPAPTAPPPAATMPVSASAEGGLLSEGVREANGGAGGGAGSGGGVIQGSDPSSTKPPAVSPYLPLIGLNAGSPPPAAGTDAPKANAPVQTPATKPAEPEPRQPATPTVNKPAPAAAPQPQAPTAATPRIEYLIKSGDTFVSIAEDWFGDETKWSLIARENPTVDPQKLKIGQKIFLPPKQAGNVGGRPDPVLVDGQTIYVVQSGDTLIAIARDHLGDGAKWDELYALNQDAIGKDPAALKVGMKLKMPKK